LRRLSERGRPGGHTRGSVDLHLLQPRGELDAIGDQRRHGAHGHGVARPVAGERRVRLGRAALHRLRADRVDGARGYGALAQGVQQDGARPVVYGVQPRQVRVAWQHGHHHRPRVVLACVGWQVAHREGVGAQLVAVHLVAVIQDGARHRHAEAGLVVADPRVGDAEHALRAATGRGAVLDPEFGAVEHAAQVDEQLAEAAALKELVSALAPLTRPRLHQDDHADLARWCGQLLRDVGLLVVGEVPERVLVLLAPGEIARQLDQRELHVLAAVLVGQAGGHAAPVGFARVQRPEPPAPQVQHGVGVEAARQVDRHVAVAEGAQPPDAVEARHVHVAERPVGRHHRLGPERPLARQRHGGLARVQRQRQAQRVPVHTHVDRQARSTLPVPPARRNHRA